MMAKMTTAKFKAKFINKVLLLLCLLITAFNVNATPKRGLTIATYNIRNYRGTAKSATKTHAKELKRIIKGTRADLIAVQEIVKADDFTQYIAANFPKYSVVLSKCGGSGHQKVGFIYNTKKLKLTAFREDLRMSMTNQCYKGLRPAAIGSFKRVGSRESFIAMSLHLKAGGGKKNIAIRSEQYEILTTIIKELRKSRKWNLILLGDFNTTEYLRRNEHYDTFISFLKKNRLHDFADAISCSVYWSGGTNNGIFVGALLDHVIMSNSYRKKFSKRKVEVQSHCKKVYCQNESLEALGLSFQEVSDHCPVVATLKK